MIRFRNSRQVFRGFTRLYSTDSVRKKPITPILPQLQSIIRANGPITFSNYMRLCLSHPLHGYYTSSTPSHIFGGDQGEQGDFATSPEISQLFGEILGIWIYSTMKDVDRWVLCELGPGKGTLLGDVMRTLKKLKEKVGGKGPQRVVCVETSPTLKHAQEQIASKYLDHFKGVEKLEHYATIDELVAEESPSDWNWLIYGNEFLDALPVDQYQLQASGKLLQTHVAIDDSHDSPLHFKFASLPGDPSVVADLDTIGLKELDVVELTPDLPFVADSLGRMISSSPDKGAVLLVDYPIKHGSSTLRAIRAHHKVHPLSLPGQTDLSSGVNFPYLCETFSKQSLQVSPLTLQKSFLMNLGILARYQNLVRESKSEEERKGLAKGLWRLLEGMGEQYTVMAALKGQKTSLLGFG